MVEQNSSAGQALMFHSYMAFFSACLPLIARLEILWRGL